MKKQVFLILPMLMPLVALSGCDLITSSDNKTLENVDIYNSSVSTSSEEKGLSLSMEEKTLLTVDEYNDYCDGRDEEFFKNYRYLKKLRKGPFYAAAIHPGGYGTVGGIRINENCQCCDKDFEQIPGLYAAGADACNIYDDSYMFLLPGNSMGFAVNTGRIAGMEAAEYVGE